MKCLQRNKQPFSFLPFVATEYVRDADGNLTGERFPIYGEPVTAYANISHASGYSETEQFGNNLQYDRVIVTDDLDIGIDENSVVFIDKPVTYNADGAPEYNYIVKRVAKSLNSVSIAISEVKTS